MLKLKLQYFGHLMPRADSFEKTLMLGKIEGRRMNEAKCGCKSQCNKCSVSARSTVLTCGGSTKASYVSVYHCEEFSAFDII